MVYSDLIDNYDDWSLLTNGDYSYLKDQDTDSLRLRCMNHVSNILVTGNNKAVLSEAIQGYFKDTGTEPLLHKAVRDLKSPAIIGWHASYTVDKQHIKLVMGRIFVELDKDCNIFDHGFLDEKVIQSGRSKPK